MLLNGGPSKLLKVQFDRYFRTDTGQICGQVIPVDCQKSVALYVAVGPS